MFVEGDGDSAVIDFDFFVSVQIVVDESLLASADEEAADFDGAEPIDVEGGEESVSEVEVEVSDVFDATGALCVAGTEGGEASGESADEEVDNGEVMRCEVPDDVDVMLEESEVNTNAVDVVDLTEVTGVDEGFDFSDGCSVNECVVNHQDSPGGFRGIDHVLSVCDGGRHGFFDEYMFTGVQGGDGEWSMGGDGRGDDDGVDIVTCEQCLVIFDGFNGGVAGESFPESCGISVADGYESGCGAGVEVSDEIGAPVSGANHGYIHHCIVPEVCEWRGLLGGGQ